MTAPTTEPNRPSSEHPMPPASSTSSARALSDEIADEAAHWVAEHDCGLMDAEAEARFKLWLSADPEHARAYDAMQDLWREMADVPVTPLLKQVTPKPQPALRRSRDRISTQRHKLTRLGGAIAAAVALCVITVTAADLPMRLQADAITTRGEQKRLRLPDGSEVWLNTDSAVDYSYTDKAREIRLLRGEAHFTVAADPDRPFRVASSQGSTTALGTQFIVRREKALTRISVTEHVVKVASGTATANVSEGYGVTYDKTGLGPVHAIQTADADAWRQGWLVFENRPLSEVVAELNRYHPGLIRVIGKAQQDRRVSGVFSIKKPVESVETIRRMLGLKAHRLGDSVIILYDEK
ncbi:MAG: FecR family protein [Asticcacaulis sp.]